MNDQALAKSCCQNISYKVANILLQHTAAAIFISSVSNYLCKLLFCILHLVLQYIHLF